MKEEIKKENVFAFPLTDGKSFATDGMTLRDYFAAKTISELVRVETDNYRFLHSSEKIDNVVLNAAKTAYSIADAMMKARGE